MQPKTARSILILFSTKPLVHFCQTTNVLTAFSPSAQGKGSLHTPPEWPSSPSESPLSTGRWECYTASSEQDWLLLVSCRESQVQQAQRRLRDDH